MAFKLDIRDVLRALDRRNMAFFDSLTDEERKGWAAPVVLRWMSAVQDDSEELRLFLVNTIANLHFHDLYAHPELQYKLLASCGGGYVARHHWIPMAKAPTRRTTVHDFLSELHPTANDFELDLLFHDMTRIELLGLINDCALLPDRTKAILDAFDKDAKAKETKA